MLEGEGAWKGVWEGEGGESLLLGGNIHLIILRKYYTIRQVLWMFEEESLPFCSRRCE